MAGGILKGFGITLIVLGIVLLVAGIAAAAYGYNAQQENHDRLLPSGDREDEAETALAAGALAAGAGVVLLIVGVVLNAAGNGRRHRELLAATRTQGPAPSTPPTPPTPPPASPSASHSGSKAGIAIALVSLAVLAAAVLGLVVLGKGGSAVGFANHSPTFEPLDFNGTVRQAFSLPVAGATTADSAGSEQEFDAPDGAHALHIDLTWDRADAGADSLEIIVEQSNGSGWTELGRGSGATPVALDAVLDGGHAHLRYRVFPDGNAAVAEQPFHVRATFG